MSNPTPISPSNASNQGMQPSTLENQINKDLSQPSSQAPDISSWKNQFHRSMAMEKLRTEWNTLEYRGVPDESPPFFVRQSNTLQDPKASILSKIAAGASLSVVLLLSCYSWVPGIPFGIVGGILGLPFGQANEWAAQGILVPLNALSTLIGVWSYLTNKPTEVEAYGAIKSLSPSPNKDDTTKMKAEVDELKRWIGEKLFPGKDEKDYPTWLKDDLYKVTVNEVTINLKESYH